jgi:hypothetical protein
MGSAQSQTNDIRALEKLYDKQMRRQIFLTEHFFAERQANKVIFQFIQRPSYFQQAQLHELLIWEYLGAAAVTISTVLYGLKTQNKFAIVPLVPVIMIVGYHTEKSKNEYSMKIRKAASHILDDPEQAACVKPVGGPITLAELDSRRKKWKMDAL